MSDLPSTAALIPVKSFADGKTRLRGALTDAERDDLARSLATAVLRACTPISPHVVCDDDDVASWARAHGATVIRQDRPGLNEAVTHGAHHLAEAGYDRILITHGDLADPSGLVGLLALDGVVLVPDHAKDGTNVVVVPAHAGFRFSYGPNSFARHLSEAERIGVAIHVVVDDGLSLDVDDPGDLVAFRSATTATIDATAGTSDGERALQ